MNHADGANAVVVTPARHAALSERATPKADSVPALAWLIGAAFVAVELAVSGRYGYLQDELYFIEAGRHLALGYVDQPPLAPLLTRMVTDLVGISPTAIRVIPALAGGAIVVLAARLAALFGAGRLGRVLAALAMACAPVLLGAAHIANTTPLDLLAWAVVSVCVCTALLRDKPRWWVGAGLAAGVGLQADNLVALLVLAILAGIAVTRYRVVLRTRWPWLGGIIAAVIWAPNLGWQATHGWPQLQMASALHQQNNSVADYLGGLPVQVLYLGLLTAPLVIAGLVRLWRTPELRFLAVATTIVVLYVLAWVPGKTYYSDGMAPAVLAAGAVAAERWLARGRRHGLRLGLVLAAPLAGMLVTLPLELPVLPVAQLHNLPASDQQATLGDTVGWPQLTRAVAAQDAELVRDGQRPTSIFTGWYAEAAALNVLGAGDHLPPVLSGHNAYWMWGPGRASDQTVLVVDAIGQLRPYFASCRVVAIYRAPYQVRNDWTDIQIGVCTGPVAGWHAFWPRLRHYQ
jgi:4-amino-4-deoxy-L-arabinose transferase-like glycosyltransferase